MNRTTRLAAGCLLLLVGCWVGCNQPSNVPDEPACVIDFWIVSAVVKIDTTTGNPATYFTLFLIYHFVGKPGTIDGASIFTSTSDLAHGFDFEPVRPTPPEVHSLMDLEFHDPSTFPGESSLLIRIGIGGRFWERTDSKTTDYCTFSLKEILWVRIQR